MLLKQKSVQDELKLTKAQVAAVEAAAEKEMRAFNGFFPLGPEERARRMKEMGEESDRTAAKTLDPGQAKRLRQISLQVRGPRAFADPQVSRGLGLTEEQQRQIGEIVEETDRQMGRLFRPGAAPEEANRKWGELDKNAREKVLKLMTAGQKARWEEMTGEPFRGPIGKGLPGIRRVRVSP
jgi:hypothetical protein